MIRRLLAHARLIDWEAYGDLACLLVGVFGLVVGIMVTR